MVPWEERCPEGELQSSNFVLNGSVRGTSETYKPTENQTLGESSNKTRHW